MIDTANTLVMIEPKICIGLKYKIEFNQELKSSSAFVLNVYEVHFKQVKLLHNGFTLIFIF